VQTASFGVRNLQAWSQWCGTMRFGVCLGLGLIRMIQGWTDLIFPVWRVWWPFASMRRHRPIPGRVGQFFHPFRPRLRPFSSAPPATPCSRRVQVVLFVCRFPRVWALELPWATASPSHPPTMMCCPRFHMGRRTAADEPTQSIRRLLMPPIPSVGPAHRRPHHTHTTVRWTSFLEHPGCI